VLPSGTEDRSQSAVSTVLQDEPVQTQVFTETQVLQRQATFGLWCLGFVVLAAVTNYLVAIPIALIFFLKVLAKEQWKTTLYVTIGTWILIYGLFDLAVGVNLG